jgi:threonine/homoserine/homoserine lactone efflux protein
MRDISFLEWFLLGMPWEWAALTAVVGAAFLVWVGASTWLERWRRERRERQGGREGDGRQD